MYREGVMSACCQGVDGNKARAAEILQLTTVLPVEAGYASDRIVKE